MVWSGRVIGATYIERHHEGGASEVTSELHRDEAKADKHDRERGWNGQERDTLGSLGFRRRGPF